MKFRHSLTFKRVSVTLKASFVKPSRILRGLSTCVSSHFCFSLLTLLTRLVVVVTPPKRLLSPSQTLFKEGLYPAARLHLTWTGKDQPVPGQALLRVDVQLFTPEPPMQEQETLHEDSELEYQASPTPAAAATPTAAAVPANPKASGGLPKWFGRK
jgi:hypothetical protein